MSDKNTPSVSGSPDNEGVKKIRSEIFSHGAGKLSLSNRNFEKASSVVISDEGVFISNLASSGGVRVDNDGVSTQGVFRSTSKGENVIKGEYSENPRSAKIFTYQETILPESIPKELAAEIAGKAGMNLSAGTGLTNKSLGMDGVVPVITDISAGPLPHFHSISMKHVHRVEPAYLYRVPTVVGMFVGAKDQLANFFSVSGPSTFKIKAPVAIAGVRG